MLKTELPLTCLQFTSNNKLETISKKLLNLFLILEACQLTFEAEAEQIAGLQ